jgi:hypothetical protein
MVVVTMLGLLLFAVPTDLPEDISPGNGIGLAPNPIVRPVVGSRSAGSGGSAGRSPSSPVIPVPVSVALAAGAVGVGYRRRRDDPLIVVVHGDGGSAGDFRYLVRTLGMDPDRVVSFDYSSVDGGASSTESSRTVPTWAAAAALDSLLRDLSMDNANIYSIHHSRGGAVGAKMIADIDEGHRPPIDGYRGAALLDPAIASGMTGVLQTLGGLGWGLGKVIPDDGGVDPIRCDGLSCRDVRAGLGNDAGVEVVASRNPDAVVTNFHGAPEGLRVFDLVDDKPSALWYVGNLFAFRRRVSEAHASVLLSPLVAECLRSELGEPGSCTGLGPRSSAAAYAGKASGGGATKAM